MLYKAIGTTGMSASIIGLGTEHLDNKPYETVKEVIHAALDNGIGIMDLFMPGDEVRRNIGRALSGRREKMLIQGHVGSVDLREQYDVSRDRKTCQAYFENLLRCLNTDYIDIGMLFFMDSQEDFRAVHDNGILDYLLALKEKGTIRAIGASSHNPSIASRLVMDGCLDLLMFSINPAFDLMPSSAGITDMLDGSIAGTPAADPERARLYRLCEAEGVAITVMKTLGAGKLLSADHSPFEQPLTPAQCIHYALTRPAVVSVLVGCQSAVQVREAIAYLDMSDQDRDYAPVVSRFKENASGFGGVCVYCNHCLPCPSSIDIASVHRHLDVARLDISHVPTTTAAQYRAMPAHASNCIACGSCESRCPFGVRVIEHMREAASIFGQ